MRKFIMSSFAALAASTALGFGGAAAEAATTEAPAQVASIPGSWRYVNWYWTYGNCASNGGQMVARGQASNWRCDQNKYGTFDLYVYK
jgi:hypothetical protein